MASFRDGLVRAAADSERRCDEPSVLLRPDHAVFAHLHHIARDEVGKRARWPVITTWSMKRATPSEAWTLIVALIANTVPMVQSDVRPHFCTDMLTVALAVALFGAP